MENEEVNEEIEFPITADPKPVYMKRSGQPVEVGHAIVTRHEHRTEIQIILDTEDGNEFGSMVVTDLMYGVSLGGVLDPEVAKEIFNKKK